MNPEKTIDVKDMYFAFVEGEDEEGNPIYGEPAKLTDIRKIEVKHEEEY